MSDSASDLSPGERLHTKAHTDRTRQDSGGLVVTREVLASAASGSDRPNEESDDDKCEGDERYMERTVQLLGRQPHDAQEDEVVKDDCKVSASGWVPGPGQGLQPIKSLSSMVPFARG